MNAASEWQAVLADKAPEGLSWFEPLGLAPFSSVGLIVVVLALILDLWLGDPRWLPHPVVGMGRLIAKLESVLNRGSQIGRRLNGIALVLIVVGLVWAASAFALGLAASVSPWWGLALELLLIWTCLACRGLVLAARQVAVPLMAGDLAKARRAVSAIVGRDTRELDESGVTRACVESVAENTVDGITAPLFWALVGGAPLALAYKAINTLDSMVGHRSERYLAFGWAAARLDDLVNLVPARLTALAMWLVMWLFMWLVRWIVPAPLRGDYQVHGNVQGALGATRRQAPSHPSPNAGWPEAMVANLLGVQLGGINRYGEQVSRRAVLGTPLQPLRPAHIAAAIHCLYAGTLGSLIVMSLAILALGSVV
ncbi:adenosylcobinamide-phosphate synthase CbiB [Halomonas sp. DP5Y7-2]|uniref:adenosylcobinamide-phosphate synthase CbiB n=1 Tax=Halomonas sp. DP5Y7-2 TaxID=2859076 RepID=UPI001C993F40|nr:adenosylcobinamide-phosphate synthase CbiB [Halomonas sp. DP5Y7-2]MBY5984786.1 adenosylcobinamide-phosphate synthase CbiB [Halomonas sp. DP5Y7-2]